MSRFLRHLEHEEHQVSRAEFELNLFGKLNDRRILDDIVHKGEILNKKTHFWLICGPWNKLPQPTLSVTTY